MTRSNRLKFKLICRKTVDSVYIGGKTCDMAFSSLSTRFAVRMQTCKLHCTFLVRGWKRINHES